MSAAPVITSLLGALLGYNYGSKGMSREASAVIGGVGGFLIGRWAGGGVGSGGVGEIPLTGDPNVVRQVVRGRIKALYEEALKTKPTLTGKIKVHWTITPEGTVENVSTSENTMGEPFGEAIKEAIRGLHFRGVQGDVTYPFALAPSTGFIGLGKKDKEEKEKKRAFESKERLFKEKEMARAERKAQAETELEAMELATRLAIARKAAKEAGVPLPEPAAAPVTPAAATAKAAGLVEIGNIYNLQ